MKKQHHIDYIEFSAIDLTKTKKFYNSAFGWKFTDYGPDYIAFTDGDFEGGFAKGEVKKKRNFGHFIHRQLNRITRENKKQRRQNRQTHI